MIEGIYRITKSQPGDLPYPEKATDPVVLGMREYMAAGLHLIHGPNGFGFYRLPLPWGRSPNIDAYLAHWGHQRPA